MFVNFDKEINNYIFNFVLERKIKPMIVKWVGIGIIFIVLCSWIWGAIFSYNKRCDLSTEMDQLKSSGAIVSKDMNDDFNNYNAIVALSIGFGSAFLMGFMGYLASRFEDKTKENRLTTL